MGILLQRTRSHAVLLPTASMDDPKRGSIYPADQAFQYSFIARFRVRFPYNRREQSVFLSLGWTNDKLLANVNRQ